MLITGQDQIDQIDAVERRQGASAALTVLFANDFADYDTSTVAYFFQGDNRKSIEGTISAEDETGEASAAIYFYPRFTPLFGAVSVPGLNGSAMTVSTVTNDDGTTSLALVFAFPAGWGDSHLPPGDWLAYAELTYSDGSIETYGMNAVIRVKSLTAPAYVGPVDTGNTPPSASLLTLLNAMKAELDAIKAALPGSIDSGQL